MTVVCDGLVAVASNHCPSMLLEVTAVATRFRIALTLFGKCHNGYNSGVITDAAIDQLGKFWHTQWWQLEIDS